MNVFPFLHLLLGLACSNNKQNDTLSSTTDAPNVVGLWDCIERDGMSYPRLYVDEDAQEYLGDENVSKLFQILQLDINEDNGGELISYFDVTESDGETYSFDFGMPITVKNNNPRYTISAQNEDGEDEIVFRCTLTNSGILTCTYTDMLEGSEGSINFLQ